MSHKIKNIGCCGVCKLEVTIDIEIQSYIPLPHILSFVYNLKALRDMFTIPKHGMCTSGICNMDSFSQNSLGAEIGNELQVLYVFRFTMVFNPRWTLQKYRVRNGLGPQASC